MARSNPVLAAIKRSDPNKVKVYLGGGAEPKELAVTTRKQKWAILWDSIQRYPNWVRLECLRKDNAVLAVVDNPEADVAELEDLAEDRVDDELYRAVGNQSKLILRGIDQVLQRTNRHQEGLLDACTKLLHVLSDRMVELERMQATYLERMAAEAFAGENAGLMSDKLVELMAPQLIQQILQKPGTPKNGKPGRPPSK